MMLRIHGRLCILTYFHIIFIDDECPAVNIVADLFFFVFIQLLLQIIIFYFSFHQSLQGRFYFFFAVRRSAVIVFIPIAIGIVQFIQFFQIVIGSLFYHHLVFAYLLLIVVVLAAVHSSELTAIHSKGLLAQQVHLIQKMYIQLKK